MILQSLGCVMLILSSGAISYELLASKKKRIRELDELSELIKHIRNNIDYFMTPIHDILLQYSSDSLKKCGFIELMHKSGLKSAVMQSSVSLNEKEKQMMTGFSEKLGNGYRDEEIKLCEYYISKLTEISEKEKNLMEKNKNLYKFIPALGAVSLIIAII